jgi:ribose-phosphate pyrophosphokinase
MLDTGRFARLLVVDPHGGALEGFHTAPLDPLSAVPSLTEALRAHAGPDAVVVAPDVGAVKLARRYAEALGLPTAVVHKKRLSGEAVTAHDVVGDVAGLRPIIVDDMISSGSTIVAAAEAVRARGAVAAPVVAASHALLVGDAAARLAAVPIARLVTTDTVPLPASTPFPLDVVPIAPLLAEAIARLDAGRALGELLAVR